MRTPARLSLRHRLGRWSLLPLVPLAWPLGFAYGLWRRRQTLWRSRPTLSPSVWHSLRIAGLSLLGGASLYGIFVVMTGTVGPWLWHLLPSWPASPLPPAPIAVVPVVPPPTAGDVALNVYTWAGRVGGPVLGLVGAIKTVSAGDLMAGFPWLVAALVLSCAPHFVATMLGSLP